MLNLTEALELTKESGYTKAELEAYDKYWDSIRTKKTLIADAEAKGEQIGIQKEKVEVILKGHENGISISLLSNITQMSKDEVSKILQTHRKID
ncbi:MAG: hypothetical protein IPM42_00155 [Saprospiraceae bacterium]|nr:hypothetical protein [Saprospiraceae bacterium]